MFMPPPFDAEEALQLRAAGATWTELGRIYGVNEKTVRLRVDPDYRKAQNRRRNARRHEDEYRRPREEGQRLKRQSIAIDLDDGPRLSRREVLSRLEARPPDTRSLTGRICGDPLVGESALDRERQKKSRRRLLAEVGL